MNHLRRIAVLGVFAALVGCTPPATTGPVTPTLSWSVTDHISGKTTEINTPTGTINVIGRDNIDVTLQANSTGGVGQISLSGNIVQVQCGYISIEGGNTKAPPPVPSHPVDVGAPVNKVLKAQDFTNNTSQTVAAVITWFNDPTTQSAIQLCPVSYPNSNQPNASWAGETLNGTIVFNAFASAFGNPNFTESGTLTVVLGHNRY
jgi:hypothetical protein